MDKEQVIKKYINKYQDYMEESEDSVEEILECIQINLFDFCACGRPIDNIKYITGALLLLQYRNEILWEEDNKKESYDIWKKLCENYFKREEVAYFMWYSLNNKDLEEHGGSVPGWLSEEGLELLNDLLCLFDSNLEDELKEITRTLNIDLNRFKIKGEEI